MEEEKEKNYFFCLYFWHISPCFYSNFDPESSFNEYPLGLLLMDPATPKTRNMMSSSHFLGISCFWGSGVRQKYAEWVIVGCRIQFRIHQDLSIEIWVKTRWYMSKIQTKKYFFYYDTYPQIYIKKVFKIYTVFQI